MSMILPSPVDCPCPAATCDDGVTVITVPGPPGPPGEQGPPGTASSLLGTFIVDTLLDAQALPTLPTNRFMTMFGRDTVIDGFGGDFRWDATSLDLDDGGATTVTPNDSSGAGRWKRWI